MPKTGLVNLTQQVDWWIRSDDNPLWNAEGKSILNPGGGPPQDLVLRLEDMKTELGEPPDDLGWGYLR